MGHYAVSEQKVDGCIFMSTATATAVAVIVDVGVPVVKVRGPVSRCSDLSPLQ